MNCDICLTKSFQADRDPRERGPRPLNSHRWAGASRRPNGTGVMHALLSGAAPANRSFNRTIAGYSRTQSSA